MNLPARALVALAVAAGAAGCSEVREPVAEGHPLVLDLPAGWEEVPDPDPGGGDAADPVVYAARPGSGPDDGGLTVQAFPAQVSTIETGISLAEAGREVRWQGYDSELPADLNVQGADAARRIDYSYTCADTGEDCSGAVFVLLRERDLYLVRMSLRDGEAAPAAVKDLEESLAFAG